MLSVAVMVLLVYILLSSMLPELTYQLKLVVAPQATTSVVAPVVAKSNRLYIPSIGLDQLILEGPGESTLDNGLWRRPQSSTPENGSNTVIAGHRIMYANSNNSFYHLSKVKTGEMIKLDWLNKRYTYRVEEIKVVQPADVSVESPTTHDQITLYTCTPLVTMDKRLVVVARRVPNV